MRNEWPSRETLQVGSHNEVADPLVKPRQVMLPPLHKKLVLMKNFVKVINKESPAFAFIKHTIPQVSDAKLKAGIFDGPQIRSLMKDENFNGIISETEKNAWQAFRFVMNNFLGNKNYSRANAEFQSSGSAHVSKSACSKIASRLFSCGKYNEEQGKRFHQDIPSMEEGYMGRWGINMLADYCWCLKRDLPGEKHKRKSFKESSLPH